MLADMSLHGAPCYLDAYVEPKPPSRGLRHVLREAREQDLNRVREASLHLCRLRYFSGRTGGTSARAGASGGAYEA
jgi:hypothetical protein